MKPIPLPTPLRRGLLIAAAALLLAACGSDDVESKSPATSGSAPEQTAPPAESESRGKAGTY